MNKLSHIALAGLLSTGMNANEGPKKLKNPGLFPKSPIVIMMTKDQVDRAIKENPEFMAQYGDESIKNEIKKNKDEAKEAKKVSPNTQKNVSRKGAIGLGIAALVGAGAVTGIVISRRKKNALKKQKEEMHEINERNKYIYENPRYYRRLFNSACEKIEINYTPQQYQVINSIDVRISLCISKCDKIDEINDLARIEKLNVYLKLLKKLSFQTKNSRINPKHFDIFIQGLDRIEGEIDQILIPSPQFSVSDDMFDAPASKQEIVAGDIAGTSESDNATSGEHVAPITPSVGDKKKDKLPEGFEQDAEKALDGAFGKTTKTDIAPDENQKNE